MKKDRIALTLALGFVLSVMAYVGIIVTAWGHFSSGRNYYLNMVFAWPLLLVADLMPDRTSPLVSFALGLLLHFAFYTFIAWLVLATVRKLRSAAS